MRSPLPLLCLILLAPACLAQSRPDDAARTDAVEQTRPGGEAPRSAMGRVMGIMIEALRQEAARGSPAGVDGTTRNGGPDDETLDIEVGDAFRLQPPARASVRAGCDVQPCDRDSVPNLRIASQK